MKKLLVLTLYAFLFGCAAGPTPEQVAAQNYITTQRPKAENGNILWSDYFRDLYDLQVRARAPSFALQGISELISSARLFELKIITKDEFDAKRRQVGIDIQRQGEALQARNEDIRRAQGAAIAAAFAAQPPVETAYQIVKPVTLQAPTYYTPPIQQQNNGVTAMWTGQQKQVQTVTYQMGWNCEYRYLSNTFWRVFTTSCPSTVQVQ